MSLSWESAISHLLVLPTRQLPIMKASSSAVILRVIHWGNLLIRLSCYQLLFLSQQRSFLFVCLF